VAASNWTDHLEQIYVFEVVQVVARTDRDDANWGLRLICDDEAKEPVTAIANLGLYLIVAEGQKVRHSADICQSPGVRAAFGPGRIPGCQCLCHIHQDVEEPGPDWRHGQERLVLRLSSRLQVESSPL
jgi:hypothetical protein